MVLQPLSCIVAQCDIGCLVICLATSPPAARTKNRHRSCCVCRALPAVMPATLAHTRERLLEQRDFSIYRGSMVHGNFVVFATVEPGGGHGDVLKDAPAITGDLRKMKPCL